MPGGAPRAAQRGLVMAMHQASRRLAATQQAGAPCTAAIGRRQQRPTALDPSAPSAAPPPAGGQQQQQQQPLLHAARFHGSSSSITTSSSSPWIWRGQQQPWATDSDKVADTPSSSSARRRACLVAEGQRRPMSLLAGLAGLMPGSGSSSSSNDDDASTTSRGGRAYRERRLVGYPPQQLFSVIADVARYREFVPWCRASRVLREDPDGSRMEAELEVGFQALSERYVSHVRLQRPGEPAAAAAAAAAQNGSGAPAPGQPPPTAVVEATTSRSMLFEHLASTWTLRPGPQPGTTWLAFAVEFGFASPAHRHVADLFFDQVVRRMVAAFEGRCASLYGASALEQRRGWAVGAGEAGGGGRAVATTHGAQPAAGGDGRRAVAGECDAAALGPLPSAPPAGAARPPLPPLDHGEDPCRRRRGN